jgi:predicted nucleic acid-binding Zn ribbon protein
MNHLSKVLDDALRRLDGSAGLEARAVMLWPEIVGPQISRATEATGARGGTLIITVRSEAWSSELSFLKTDLLRRYRKRLGEEFVKDLRCKVGRVRGTLETASPQTPPDSEVRRLKLPASEVARIAEAADTTEDPELAQAIRRALTHEAQLRQWRLSHGSRLCVRCGAAYRTARPFCPACVQDEGTRNSPNS